MVATATQIALVHSLLPSAALTDYSWDDAKVAAVIEDNSFTPTEAVRFFWLERVNESAEYIDVSGKPLSAIHAQARAMLDYWDNVIRNSRESVTLSAKRPMSFGEIDRS